METTRRHGQTIPRHAEIRRGALEYFQMSGFPDSRTEIRKFGIGGPSARQNRTLSGLLRYIMTGEGGLQVIRQFPVFLAAAVPVSTFGYSEDAQWLIDTPKN